ncbi:MAG: hypothetical protein M3162_08085 [Thermoproteota archaeon]|nr:hypothetical protein [Thermoproteota archaeon]
MTDIINSNTKLGRKADNILVTIMILIWNDLKARSSINGWPANYATNQATKLKSKNAGYRRGLSNKSNRNLKRIIQNAYVML